MTKQISIMIVDDHAVIRTGLRMLIEQDFTMKVVAMAGNSAEAFEQLAKETPDIIILDLVLGDEDGLTLLPTLREKSPTTRVLILTGVLNPDAHRAAIRKGAMGIVLKEHAADLLLKAIKKVNDGEVWIDRSMMGMVIQCHGWLMPSSLSFGRTSQPQVSLASAASCVSLTKSSVSKANPGASPPGYPSQLPAFRQRSIMPVRTMT